MPPSLKTLTLPVLHSLLAGEGFNIKSISLSTGAAPSKVRRVVAELIEKGWIIRINKARRLDDSILDISDLGADSIEEFTEDLALEE